MEPQWSRDFESLMRNRLVVGALRYGLLGESKKPAYDRIAAMRKYLDRYEATGNTEILVDLSNVAMLEFVEGTHINRHFKSTDDEEHVS